MKSVSGKTLYKIIERKGWALKRVTDIHHIYIKQGIDAILSIQSTAIAIYQLGF
jgi:predicted RNA binding protein YcfA (HicA-like mRNA interferase family)